MKVRGEAVSWFWNICTADLSSDGDLGLASSMMGDRIDSEGGAVRPSKCL